MNGEFEIQPTKTYASADRVRAAIRKTGDEKLRHTILQNAEGRFFVVFFPNESQMSETGIHFRWNCIR